MRAGNHSVEIRQIFYSEQTRQSLDVGYIPLDNVGQRPDWREYWPMRNFLLNNELDEHTLYGFFSPKFRQKTGLDSQAVYNHIAGLRTAPEIVAYSPFYDQGAFYLNVFEQATDNHPGTARLLNLVVSLLAPGVDPGSLIMDSRHSIFCNYFAATPRFWRRWLEMCEVLFVIAEQGSGELHDLLNADVPYDQSGAPAKVFVIERLASLILATDASWSVAHYNGMRLPWSGSRAAHFVPEVIALDALKMIANSTGQMDYMQAFLRLRESLSQRAAAPHG